jgi:hypothetical protein
VRTAGAFAIFGAMALVPAPCVAHAAAPDALCARLKQIETAFRQGNAVSLRSTFASSGKVRLDLQELTTGPVSYAPGQAQVILSRLFEGRRTRDFGFQKGDLASDRSGTAFARATWSWQTRTRQEGCLSLTFILGEEGGDWRVREILASP